MLGTALFALAAIFSFSATPANAFFGDWFQFNSTDFDVQATSTYPASGFDVFLKAIDYTRVTGLDFAIDQRLESNLVTPLTHIADLLAFNAELQDNLDGHSYSMTVDDPDVYAGLITESDKNKLDTLSIPLTRWYGTTTRSIVTGTGATGFQISSTRDVDAHYNTTIVTTASIGGSQSGTLVLEIADHNSATAGDWREVGRCTNGQAITLALALQSVQTIGCQLNGFVPQGYYAKIRSINNAGTPTFTFNSSQEVKL